MYSTGGAVMNFDPLRKRLTLAAYRMLGSWADAEDAVQEAFLRWNRVDQSAVREPEAFLRRVLMRICLDEMKSARRQREHYVGEWLPEPLVEADEAEVDDFTLPLLLAMERLSPLERAAFLLHDVFGAEFEEIAETLGRTPAACRQLATRARANVRSARPRFPVSRQKGLEIATAFFTASREGDLSALRTMLAADVVVHADGGGKMGTLPTPVVGCEAVLDLHATLHRVFAETASQLIGYRFINGLPGFVTIEQKQVLQTTALALDGQRIQAIYVVRNPDKLERVQLLAQQ